MGQITSNVNVYHLTSNNNYGWYNPLMIFFVKSGGPLNLYREQMMCLHFGRSSGGDRDQCINPEGLASFLGLLESLPSRNVEDNQEFFEGTNPNTRFLFSMFYILLFLLGFHLIRKSIACRFWDLTLRLSHANLIFFLAFSRSNHF